MDWFATLIQARGRPRDRTALCRRTLWAPAGQLLLIVLDSSGSTLKDQRLSAAKGALGSLVEAVYSRRLRIGILQFAGKGAWLSVPPRRAPKQALGLTRGIAGGGGTPLRQALEEAVRVLGRERKRFPNEQQTVVLFTDGRSRDRIDGIQIPCRILVIDTETGPLRLGRCRQLASALNGDYLTLDELPIRKRDG